MPSSPKHSRTARSAISSMAALRRIWFAPSGRPTAASIRGECAALPVRSGPASSGGEPARRVSTVQSDVQFPSHPVQRRLYKRRIQPPKGIPSPFELPDDRPLAVLSIGGSVVIVVPVPGEDSMFIRPLRGMMRSHTPMRLFDRGAFRTTSDRAANPGLRSEVQLFRFHPDAHGFTGDTRVTCGTGGSALATNLHCTSMKEG
jgi:hypothetical protein